MGTVATIIVAVLGSVGAYFKWKSSAVRQRRLAAADIKKEQERSEMKKQEIRAAVYSNDDEALNQIVARLLAPALVIVGLMSGCSTPETRTVYIPTDRRIETCTNSIGVVCKAVPNAVMEEMLVKLQELEDLKTEQKVDKRVAK